MQRYRQYGPLDDTLEVFGDAAVAMLDMKSDPAVLTDGWVQASENMRMDTNGAAPRNGIARQFTPGTAIGTIHFAGIYKQVGQYDQLALVTDSRLWLFNPWNQGLTAYPYPTGERVDEGDSVDLEQAGIGSGSTLPQLFICRGFTKTVLMFDGVRVTVNSAVPKSQFALAYQNRLAVNSTAQAISTSDFLDFATWHLLNQFQIEQGGSDYLVGLMAYQSDYVLIGSRKKWFLAYFDPTLASTGYSGALQNSSFLRLQTSEAGPLGKEAMIESAGVIWFVADHGIYAFQPNLNNQLVTLGKPLSADIQPVFSRINAAAAAGACIQRYGYRLYFALPISDVPVQITAASVAAASISGVTLPVTLPFLLSAGALMTVTTATAHNLSVGDLVQLAGISSGGINGQWNVLSVPDATSFTVALPSVVSVTLGKRATAQKLALRNNTIAVLNLNNRDANHPLGIWESIDSLPSGMYADWLRLADYGAQRRLWLVDADLGPALYEEGTADETGTILGGVTLPFTLPITLSDANFASVPVAGRILSRTYRWTGVLGSPHGTLAYVRRVRSFEVRATAEAGDAVTVNCQVKTPGRIPTTVSASLTSDGSLPDEPISQRIGARGLEAELEILTTAGQPTIRSLEIQVSKTGQY